MKKTFLTVLFLMSIGGSQASFDSVYTQFIDSMSTISSPSIVQSISAKGNNISSTTNLTISLDTPNSNQVSGKITIKADGIMNTTGTLQASGNIMIDGKGSIEGNTGSLKGSLDYILKKENLFFKVSGLEIPMQDVEAKTMINLFSEKRLQVPLSGTTDFDEITTKSLQNINNQKKILDSLKQNKILSPLKEGTMRNDYEVYPITLNPLGFKTFINNFTPIGEVSDEEVVDSFEKDVNMYGVIGVKGDEVKMGMMIKEKLGPVLLPKSKTLITYSSKGKEYTIGMLIKENKKKVMSATLNVKSLSESSNSMTLLLNTDDFDLKVDSSTKYYDTGTGVLQDPKNAILLDDLSRTLD